MLPLFASSSSIHPRQAIGETIGLLQRPGESLEEFAERSWASRDTQRAANLAVMNFREIGRSRVTTRPPEMDPSILAQALVGVRPSDLSRVSGRVAQRGLDEWTMLINVEIPLGGELGDRVVGSLLSTSNPESSGDREDGREVS